MLQLTVGLVQPRFGSSRQHAKDRLANQRAHRETALQPSRRIVSDALQLACCSRSVIAMIVGSICLILRSKTDRRARRPRRSASCSVHHHVACGAGPSASGKSGLGAAQRYSSQVMSTPHRSLALLDEAQGPPRWLNLRRP